MLETILIIAAIIASAFFVGRGFVGSFRKDAGCRCDAGRCPYAEKDCRKNDGSRERSETE